MRNKLLLVLVVFLVICVAWYEYRFGALNKDYIFGYYKNNPIAGVLLFIGSYILFVVCMIPTLPMNFAAGFLFGGIWGGLISSFCATLGGWVSFLIVRTAIGQPLARRMNQEWVELIQKDFDDNGWKFVALTRMNPIIPSGPLNYILGLTSLSSAQFLLPSFLFLLPPSIIVSYIGVKFEDLIFSNQIHDSIGKIFLILSLFATLFLVKYLMNILAKKKI